MVKGVGSPVPKTFHNFLESWPMGKRIPVVHPDFNREGPRFESWYPDLIIKEL